jgi:hypothetical protein
MFQSLAGVVVAHCGLTGLIKKITIKIGKNIIDGMVK